MGVLPHRAFWDVFMPELQMSNNQLSIFRQFHINLLAATAIVAAMPSAVFAQSAVSSNELSELRRAIEQLREEQRQSQAKMAALEAALARVTTANAAPTAAQAAVAAPAGIAPTQLAVNAALAPAAATPVVARRLQLSGDLRSRYETNFGDDDTRNRDRGVFRARIRAAYAVNDWLTIGGQIATGDPDDPNSADVTLGNFDDDLQVSLDQAYIRTTFGGLQLHLGKIPQPFVRTELVWDGDVSPQGVSAAYTMPVGGGATLRANALFFQVDESVAGPDSRMMGGQLAFDTPASRPLRLELAAGYYDYNLRSMAGGDAGDFRSNILASGRYVSDFNLLDVIGAVTWNGLGEQWPVRLVGDYVKNFGARTDGDQGMSVDLIVGRASRKGDLRFTYGYAQADADAVLAAFSSDNTNFGSNYYQHTLAVDFVPVNNLILNATYYHYSPKNALYAGTNDPNDWLGRLRFNMLVNF